MKQAVTNDRAVGIQKELRRLADKEIAEHSQRFFKTGKGQCGEGDRFLGIRVPALRQMPRTVLRYAIERLPAAKRQKYLKGDV
jgi:hypothetical protein